MNTQIKSNWDDAVKINIGTAAIIALSIAASFSPGWRMWGLDSPSILPALVRLLVLAASILIAVPRIGSIAGKIIHDKLRAFTKTQLNIIYFLISGSLVILFIIFTSHNHYMGDGYTILGNINSGKYLSPTEPLDYIVHYVAFTLIGNRENAVYWSYAISAYTCGALFLIGLYIFIKNKTQLILSLAVLLCFASLQFFFGYVESYTFLFAILFFYSFSAIGDLDRKGISPATLVLLCLAIVFHLSAVVMIPSAIYLAARKYSKRQKYIVLAGTIIATIFAGIMASVLFGGIGIGGVTVPLIKKADNPYSIFSGMHLKDLANLALLNYPLIIIVLLVGRLRRELGSFFYLLLIGPSILFAIVVDPKIGAYRDWDLLSISAGPILAFIIRALVMAKRKEGPGFYSIFISLAFFGILHTGGWILQNSSEKDSYSRVREFVHQDIHYSHDYLAGQRNKSWATLASKYGNDPGEVSHAAFERYLGDPDDTLNTCELAKSLLIAGDTARAIEITQANWLRFRNNSEAINAFAGTMVRTRHFEEAEQIGFSYLVSNIDNPMAYYTIASIKSYEGQKDSSYYYYDRAFKLNPDAPIKNQFGLYMQCFSNGNYDLSQSGFNRIMPRLSGNFKAYATQILQALNSGDKAVIDSLRKVVSSGAK